MWRYVVLALFLLVIVLTGMGVVIELVTFTKQVRHTRILNTHLAEGSFELTQSGKRKFDWCVSRNDNEKHHYWFVLNIYARVFFILKWLAQQPPQY